MEKLSLFVLDHRRIVIAVLVGLTVWACVSALSQRPQQVLVPVAARDLSSGSAISAQDVTFASFDRASVPAGVLEKSAIRARIVAGPMRQGEPFTDQRAIQPQRLESGEQLALVDIAVEHARLLRVGDQVDIVSLGSENSSEATVLAESVPVSVIDMHADSRAASLGVAVTPKLAHAILAAQLQAPLMAIPTKTA